nr:CLE06 protein [Ipomoea batatas]GMD41849.1 CLE06 protein [Ipomoea batatas]GMD43045.1 CLE06 protein [Ipomoea batatas]GMD44809.1 CLE06 protein [Ipomoea batatas]GMD46449.1 CLE06 protein [Ipomoea batatas]
MTYWYCLSKKHQMSVVCVCLLLLLMLLQFKAPCYADNGTVKFYRFKPNSASASAVKSHHGMKMKKKRNIPSLGLGGDDIFGGDKRKVRTGPNPLHNR